MNTHLRDVLALTGLAAAVALAPAALAAAPETPPLPVVTTTTTVAPATTTSAPATTSTTTTTTTTVPPGDWQCPQWMALALDAGFTTDDLPTVDRLILRESTCRPDAYNGSDPNGGSRGLMQINGIWCDWWLQEQGVLDTCEQLFDPLTNLRAAKAIHNRHGGFRAWGL